MANFVIRFENEYILLCWKLHYCMQMLCTYLESGHTCAVAEKLPSIGAASKNIARTVFNKRTRWTKFSLSSTDATKK